jgi:hypothetical protein
MTKTLLIIVGAILYFVAVLSKGQVMDDFISIGKRSENTQEQSVIYDRVAIPRQCGEGYVPYVTRENWPDFLIWGVVLSLVTRYIFFERMVRKEIRKNGGSR